MLRCAATAADAVAGVPGTPDPLAPTAPLPPRTIEELRRPAAMSPWRWPCFRQTVLRAASALGRHVLPLTQGNRPVRSTVGSPLEPSFETLQGRSRL